MRITTALNHQRRLAAIVVDVYAHARKYALPHQSILDTLADRVWNSPELARCPRWVRTALSAVSQNQLAMLYRPAPLPAELAKIASGEMALTAVAYLRTAHLIDGVPVTSDEIAARGKAAQSASGVDARVAVWHSVESATVWNHSPDSTFAEWRSNA